MVSLQVIYITFGIIIAVYSHFLTCLIFILDYAETRLNDIAFLLLYKYNCLYTIVTNASITEESRSCNVSVGYNYKTVIHLQQRLRTVQRQVSGPIATDLGR